jgi:hypothetical protein
MPSIFQPNVFQNDIFQVQSFSVFQPNVFQRNVFQVEDISPPVEQTGGFYAQIRRRFEIVGAGYGILPKLEGEASGIVAIVGRGFDKLARIKADAIVALVATGKSAANLRPVCGIAIGHRGQIGAADALLENLSVASTGIASVRGSALGKITCLKATATGCFDDHGLAAMTFFWAA